MVWLGEDEYGVWLGSPIGTIYGKGEECEVYATQERRVTLFPRDGWWTALFQEAPARLDVYCDDTTPSEWPHPGEVTMVDLDLDVCRTRGDRSVSIVDEDEFASHQEAYGYPSHVISHARSAAESLSAALRESVEPFNARFRVWLAQVS
ncbi:RNAse [Streptomyces sp. CB01635]|uniref:DUF402 domain-containing protein n=1 Tax=unclassified Streptomyces TaxID=2593676 RepID=UPI000C27A1F6|nr:DUF402 domain-containing protein [Streptomyces sp. CB01635]PJN05522.1 RNAse [Streptomyces sp. CB01635]